MGTQEITANYVRERLDYDPATGVFWRKAPSPAAGRVISYVQSRGYIQISLGKRRFLGHRLAWLLVYGRWPVAEIDHINGDRTDNRIANLREATRQSNQENQRRAPSHNRSSGLLGASWSKKQKRWQSYIGVNGKKRGLGYYATPEEAHEAYLTAKRQLHAGCTI